MNICGEHGSEIAYADRECPACEQVSELNDNHYEEIERIRDDSEFDKSELQDTIDELEDKIEELESKDV